MASQTPDAQQRPPRQCGVSPGKGAVASQGQEGEPPHVYRAAVTRWRVV